MFHRMQWNKEQEAYPVCKLCYQEYPYDAMLLDVTCRYPGQHPSESVLVTIEGSVLVTIRPMPSHYRPETFFSKCLDGTECTKRSSCTYAHSESEKNVWNTLLSRERRFHSPSAKVIIVTYHMV